MINLAFRGFVNGDLIFEETVSLDYPRVDPPLLFDELTRRQGAIMLQKIKPGDRHLLEIEFLDEPDQSKRFFRIGSDPSMMREPLEVDPENPAAALRKWKG